MPTTVAAILSNHRAGNPHGQREAMLSSARFLLSRFEQARCDSDGVSGCVRCNAVYLAKRIEQLVALNEEQHSPVEREGVK